VNELRGAGALLEEATGALAGAISLLTTQGRRLSLAVLGEARIADKLVLAERMVQRFEQASLLAGLLERDLGALPPALIWPEENRPDRIGLIVANAVHSQRLQIELEKGEREIARHLTDASALLSTSPVCAHVAKQVTAVASGACGATLPSTPTGSSEGLRREFRGPLRLELDPCFTVATSPELAESQPLTDAAHAPDFWRMAMRESMAGDQCCLSICELDGAPLLLLRDLAKQTWDEMRHATLFLRCAKELLPEFIAETPDGPLVRGARRYLETGAGLVVPAEGNLYASLWSADLFDRLVLMQLDGEADLPRDFREDLSSSFYLRRPALAQELAWTIREEQAHGDLGKRWLAWLIPDASAREQAIGRALLFRGFRLAIGIAAFQQVPLESILGKLAATA